MNCKMETEFSKMYLYFIWRAALKPKTNWQPINYKRITFFKNCFISSLSPIVLSDSPVYVLHHLEVDCGKSICHVLWAWHAKKHPHNTTDTIFVFSLMWRNKSGSDSEFSRKGGSIKPSLNFIYGNFSAHLVDRNFNL